MPCEPNLPEGASPEEQQAAMDSMMKQMSEGPFILAAVRIGPSAPILLLFFIQLLSDMLTAFFVAFLLWNVLDLSTKKRMLFILAIAGTVIVASNIPAWNWYAFSSEFTLAESFDL
ncbi:MAG TPA: hypothetical protein VGA55_03570 [Bacteroidota bacterium]